MRAIHRHRTRSSYCLGGGTTTVSVTSPHPTDFICSWCSSSSDGSLNSTLPSASSSTFERSKYFFSSESLFNLTIYKYNSLRSLGDAICNAVRCNPEVGRIMMRRMRMRFTATQLHMTESIAFQIGFIRVFIVEWKLAFFLTIGRAVV